MRVEFEDDTENGVAMNLMPLVDVVFLLLIFFLAATTFAREEIELDLSLPEAKSGAPSREDRQIIVNVLADGRIVVDGREVTIEALRQKLEAAGRRNREQPVLVRGDANARFGTGVRVLDACRLARLSKVDFAALPASEK